MADAPAPLTPATLSPLGLADTRYRMREPFTYSKSRPDGKRWTVHDGSGFDDDVLTMFDTEAEAAAAVKAANLVREDSVLVFATLDAERAPRAGDELREAAQAVVDWYDGPVAETFADRNARLDRLRAALHDTEKEPIR